MENWQLALVVIAAIFVGILIPAVIQYQITLRSIHRVIHANESDVRRTLMEVSQLSAHLNRISASIDGNSQHIKTFLASLEDVAEGINKVSGTLRTASIVGATVAPAIGAAIKAWQSERPSEGGWESSEGDPDSSHTGEMQADGRAVQQTETRRNGIIA